MNIYGGFIRLISKLLSKLIKRNQTARQILTKEIKKNPQIAKGIKKTILAKQNIQSNLTQSKSIPEFKLSDNDFNKLQGEYRRIELKKALGHKLSTSDINFQNFFNDTILGDDDKDEIFYFNNSSGLIMLIYKKKTKTALIKMKHGKIPFYPFYNVPRTKVMNLLMYNGEYMWDGFGTHYSANPKHGRRKRVK